MLVLYGRLTFQPACVFRGLNKGLKLCVCANADTRSDRGTADADRAALHTTASGVPNEHVSRLRQ